MQKSHHSRNAFVCDYIQLANRAIEFNIPHIAGIAFLNISREYQIAGANMKAQEFCQKSIECLTDEEGTIHYDLAILHQVHLFIDDGATAQAESMIKSLSLSPFPEVKEALKFLKALMSGGERQGNPELMTPTWQERYHAFSEGCTDKPATELESRLIQLLEEKSQDKFQLIETLYCSEFSTSLEGRLKNLLARIRRKYRNLISFKGGLYHIEDKTRARRILGFS